ncbi:MAG: magnesium transporter [Proteiniphilum sp.]|jgi:magnesium transporter|uniref:magnesium transporter n=1 Tax=Proteiniphilum sp. TaxID=1926877 RepID=UPI000AB1AACC|nr:magnesium transporter [Proteiniphilum sp.]MEA5128203.1 magnesium transporter [Proteiniphilum sp.]
MMTDTQINFQRLIKERAWTTLKTELTKLDVPDITYLIEHSNPFQSIIFFRLLPGGEATEVFSELHPDKQVEIIDGLAYHASRLTDLMNDMNPDDRTSLFEELPGKVAQQLMQLLSTENLKKTTQLLGYPEESIGRLMTPQYVAVKSHFTVAETLQHIRRFGKEAETLEVVYVVNQHWKLIADLPIRDILLAGQDEKIEDLIDHKVMVLNAFDDQETAIQVFKDYNRVALPVVDSTNTLLGIVTIDDIFDVAEEEDTEDFHKFGAVQDAIINPVLATVSFLYKKRVGWLMVLVFMNVFSGYAMSRFENVIETVVALVFFLPLLIDGGGNAGSQSATLMIRALAMGDVRRQDWIRLLSKEFTVSLMLGITMAAGVSLIASFRAPDIIPVVAITMVATVMVGSVIGMMLPLIFTRLKLDPATASAPMITTIADIMGVLIYFSMAKWFFGL